MSEEHVSSARRPLTAPKTASRRHQHKSPRLVVKCIDCERFLLEMESNAETVSSTPLSLSPHDIIMGHGPGVLGHAGNVRFRAVVRSHKREYNSTGRHRRKRDIAQQVLNEIEAYGGRFLRPGNTLLNDVHDENEWHVVDNAEVLSKIKQALREHSAGHNQVTGVENEANVPSASTSESVPQLAASIPTFHVDGAIHGSTAGPPHVPAADTTTMGWSQAAQQHHHGTPFLDFVQHQQQELERQLYEIQLAEQIHVETLQSQQLASLLWHQQQRQQQQQLQQQLQSQLLIDALASSTRMSSTRTSSLQQHSPPTSHGNTVATLLSQPITSYASQLHSAAAIPPSHWTSNPLGLASTPPPASHLILRQSLLYDERVNQQAAALSAASAAVAHSSFAEPTSFNFGYPNGTINASSTAPSMAGYYQMPQMRQRTVPAMAPHGAAGADPRYAVMASRTSHLAPVLQHRGGVSADGENSSADTMSVNKSSRRHG